MTDLPEPLTPPGCNMAGNDWFPLHFRRLRTSKWWRRASDLARARNVMLWGEAYAADQAGSLPDDDDELAEAAGFGFDVSAFIDHKAEIMAPWVLCSDGRWYHPTICEVALDAWARTSDKRKKDATRKAEQRAKSRGLPPPTPKTTPVPPETANVPPELAPVPRDTGEIARDKATQTEQTGQDIEDADASLSLGDDEAVEPVGKYPPDFEAVWKAYPHIKGRSSKSKSHGFWRRLSRARRDRLPSAIAGYAREGREPKADCGAPAMQRWLAEERYLDWMADAAPSGLPLAPTFPGPPEIRAAVVAAKDEGFARGYLDRCSWRDLPDKAVVTNSPTIEDRLTKEVGHVLQRFGARVYRGLAA
jgi:hypothetical protein